MIPIANTLTPTRTRTRAGLLLIALALVGGTGCITTALVQNARNNSHLRAMEETERQRNVALARAADAGDPQAMRLVASHMIGYPEQGKIDQARVFALLSGAEQAGDAQAQAVLGRILVAGRVADADRGKVEVAPEFQDRARGFQLLRQAATRACRFPMPGIGWPGRFSPAAYLATALAVDGHVEEARLWRARDALHCSEPGIPSLSRQVRPRSAVPPQRTEALTLLLLHSPDAATLAEVTAAVPADEVDAARRDAERLRRLVAQSEQQYPAPRQKDMKALP